MAPRSLCSAVAQLRMAVVPDNGTGVARAGEMAARAVAGRPESVAERCPEAARRSYPTNLPA